MAQKKRSARPTDNRQTTGGARRLGNQTTAPRATSSGAARRAARSRKRSSPKLAWLSVIVVVIVLVVFFVVRGTNGGGGSNSAGQSSGQNPSLASALILKTITTVPAAVFNQVGTNGEAAPFELTKTKTPLKLNGVDRFVYFGAEYCPYCALMRWSLIAALSRFGTFSGIKQTRSAISDGNIPTFSFLGSKYTSKYVAFSPYEFEDRNRNALQTPPKDVENLVSTYDFPPYTTSNNGGGIPFLSVGNVYVSGGDDPAMANLFENGTLVNGGPGQQVIANSLQDPLSSTGKAAGGPIFIAEANYLSAAICLTNGEMPSSVCTTSGVTQAEKAMKTLKPIG